MVRVRFAPSPTGKLHIGGARTALYNWLFARNRKGKFLLRIEDTDRERSKREFVEDILEGLRWLELDWDEDVVFQSDNLERYRELAFKLLESGKAYLDRYLPEEWEDVKDKYLKDVSSQKERKILERKLINDPPSEYKHVLSRREGAIRLRVPDEGEIVFEDAIRGKISYPLEHITDIVILRSNGMPTYNFAVVVDDHAMGITHVIRGDDHISNTPKQILIYKALSYEVPSFAHIPMILGPDRKKLSKRHGALSVLEYRDMGILSEALFNFIALLGWSPYPDREIVSKQEMIERFDIRKVNKHPAVFNMEKLLWMNSQYIRSKDKDELVSLVSRFIPEDVERERLEVCIELLKDRVKTLKDFYEYGDYILKDEYAVDEKAYEKYFKDEQTLKHLGILLERFSSLNTWKEKDIETTLRSLADELGIKPAKLIHPVRVAVSGKKVGPSLFILLEKLGKERVIERLRKAIERAYEGQRR